MWQFSGYNAKLKIDAMVYIQIIPSENENTANIYLNLYRNQSFITSFGISRVSGFIGSDIPPSVRYTPSLAYIDTVGNPGNVHL